MEKKLTPVGGFQSGWRSRIIKREEAKYPDYLICNHGCTYVVQLISNVSNAPEFELCAIEAAKMGKSLLDAANETYFSMLKDALLTSEEKEPTR